MINNNLEQVMNDPMLFKLYDIKNVTEDIIECIVKEQYGKGKILFITIEEGIFVEYSDCYFHYIDNADVKFNKDIITMYQMLEGNAIMNINDKKSIIVKKGDIFNFAGNNQFSSFDGDYKNLVSISIFGYYECIQRFFLGFFKDDTIVKDYYSHMKSIDGGLVYKNDLILEKLFLELFESVKDNNNYLIKLKALEIMYHCMTHHAKYVDVKRKEYDQYYIKRVYEVKNYLDENWNKKISLEEIAQLHNINKTYLKEIFKDSFDISPHKYVIKIRLSKSKELLDNRNLKITEIASMTGFSSASRYSESFKNFFGYLPSEYRKNSSSNREQ